MATALLDLTLIDGDKVLMLHRHCDSDNVVTWRKQYSVSKCTCAIYCVMEVTENKYCTKKRKKRKDVWYHLHDSKVSVYSI